MRLTTRGWTAVSLVVLTVVLAWAFGQRSLNAVAAPIIAALGAATVLVWRAEPPTVSYDPPRAGFPGQHRTLSLSVEGSGLATVRQDFPVGLTAEPVDATVPLPYTVERDLTLDARGLYEVGPPTVHQRDPLGLVERHVDADATAEVVVYPQVFTLSDPTLGGLIADQNSTERQEFDRLREYVPGDPLKNVHWKSSAKHDDFLVMEFAPSERTETVSIVAEADRHHTDRMAAAAATLLLAALDADLTVELTVPDGSLPPGQGESHRENALNVLARTGPGSVDDGVRAEADIAISAGPRSTLVRLPEGQRTFESLAIGHEQPVTDAEVVA